MRPLHPLLARRLQRVDLGARVIVEAVEAVRQDIIDLQAEWADSDSYTGYQAVPAGGVVLTGSAANAVAQSATGGYITDLNNDTPFEVAAVEWKRGGEDQVIELHKLVAKLVSQRDGGQPKDVAFWRAQLYRVVSGTFEEEYELEPITDVVEVAATGTTTPADIEFDFNTAIYLPARPGAGYIGDDHSNPVTVVFIWALQANGDPATNVGWATDGTNQFVASGSHQIGRWTLTTTAGQVAHVGRTRVAASYSVGVPTFSLGAKSYAAPVTITFSGAKALDLGGTPSAANRVEIVAEGLTPDDSSLVFEINDGGGWVQCYDGDRVGEDNTSRSGADLSAVAKQQTYSMRVTLTANTVGEASPTVYRMGVREIDTTDLDGIAIVRDPRWAISAETLKGEITEADIEVLKDGVTDYRDWASELLAARFLDQFFFRVWIGHPDIPRHAWMHIDDFYVEDYDPRGASMVFNCLTALYKIRQVLPAYDSGSGQREVLTYANSTLKAAYDDILTGQVGLPGRMVGPGIEDAVSTVSNDIDDSDAKDEMDALAYIAGGGLTTSRGRVVFKDLHIRNAPVASFARSDIAWVSVTPGYRRRVPEFFVPYSWVKDENRYDGEVRSFHDNALTKLGLARIDTHQVVNDKVSRWLDDVDLAETVAKRKTLNQGAGLIEWEFQATYPHPWLEVGDTIAVNTDMFVGRDVNTEREIRGEVWAVGVITAVTGVWGTQFRVWIRTLDDIVPTEASVTRLGYNRPEILEVFILFDSSGTPTARVRTNLEAGSVRIVGDDTVFQGRSTVQVASPAAVDSDGYAAVTLTGTYEVGDTIYVTGLAYETAAGGGAEQTQLYKQAFPVTLEEPRVIGSFDLDGDDLYFTWEGTSPVSQLRWLLDLVDAPNITEVRASVDVDTTGSILVHTFDPDGDPVQTIWFGYLPETSGAIETGGLVTRPYTYKVGSNVPTVDLIYLGRTSNGDEKWLATASGAGTNATLYYRHYADGSGPPAYTSVGPATDPVNQIFSFAHPEDGDPDIIIEAYAEDDSTPALVSDVLKKISDSDSLPSGEADLTVGQDNEAYLTPRSVDSDSLSYRFKLTVGAVGSDSYVDPSLADDADVGAATLVGTGFGVQVKLSSVLSSIAALKDGEELFLSGWMFNTASTGYAAQAGAVRSSLVRRSIPAGFIRNALNSVWLESRVATYGVFSVIVWDLHYQCATDSVKSLLIVTTDGVTPVTVREDIATKDGVVQNVRAFDFDGITGTVTPYDDIGADLGTGNAGEPQSTETTPANESAQTIIVDLNDDQHVSDVVTLASRGLSVGDDAVTGQALLGVFFDAGARGIDLTGATDETTAVNDLVAEAATVGGGRIFIGGIVQVETIRMMKGVEIVSDGWNGKLIQKANAYTTDDSGTSTGGNTTTTVNDTGKAWTVDEHKMRTLRITSGPLAGEARVIISNTATQLTVGMESGVGQQPFSGTPGTVGYEILIGSPMVVSDAADDGQWGLRNIRLDGNKSNQISYNPGVLLEATPASVEYNDSHHFLEHVLIDNVSGWGLLHGKTCRETSVIDVVVRRSDRHNIFTWPEGGTDNSHVRVISAHSGLSGIVANGTNDRWVDVKSFGCGQDAVVDQGHGWLITAQGVHGTVLQAQENEGSGFSMVDATDCQLDIRASSNQDGGLTVFRIDNCNIRMQAVGDESLLYVQPWAVVDTGGPTVNPSTNNRLDLVTDNTHTSGVVDPNFQGNDNTINVNNRIKGTVWSTWGSLGAQHEHFLFGKDSAPATNEPQYGFKSESDTPASALFESYNGTTTRTYLRFKHGAQELILGYAARVTQVTVDGARLILGTPAVAASGVPVENIGLKQGYYLYGEQTYYGGSWVKLIGFVGNGSSDYVDLSPGAYPVQTGGQINAGNVVSVFRDTGEAFRYGKTGAPASSNPYYVWKHDAGSPPLGLVESYDGTTTRSYLKLDHANDALTVQTSKLAVFNGGTPATKQTVSGSRGGNAALASLLTALATYNLITDSTT